MASSPTDNVQLAYTEKEPVTKSKRLFVDNFIGGRPYFSPKLPQELIDTSFTRQRLTCGTCQRIISFIAQIAAHIDDDNDRVIHVFACVSKSCSDKKWLVTRTKSPAIEFDSHTGSNGKDDDWLSDEDEWEDAPADTQPDRNLIGNDEIEESLALNGIDVNTFQAFFLIVDDEKFLLESDSKLSASSAGTKLDINDFPDQDIGPVSDAYERFLIPGTDQVSNKFIRRISKFPSQVIRYDLNGQPLLNKTTKVTPSDCGICGSRRRFELQLTPGLIIALSLNQDSEKRGDSGDGDSVELDFGTVLIYTCENDCGSNAVHIEQTISLSDADDELLKEMVKDKMNTT